jgi:uncharacterized protein DUF2721
MNPIAVTAVQAMVAPVVLITTAAILSGALLTMYGSVNDRMRAMDRDRLDILTGAAGTLLSAAEAPPAGRERLTQLEAQLPMLLRRHRLLHNAVLLIYAGVAVLVLSVIAIGVAVTGSSGAAGTAAPALVLGGTVMLLGGLLFAARSIMISMDAIDYEVRRPVTRVLITGPADAWPAEEGPPPPAKRNPERSVPAPDRRLGAVGDRA